METQSLKKGRFLIQEVTDPKPISKKIICRHDSINFKKQYYFKEKAFSNHLFFPNIASFVYDFRGNEWINCEAAFRSLIKKEDKNAFTYLSFNSDSSDNCSFDSSRQKTNDDSINQRRRMDIKEKKTIKNERRLSELKNNFEIEKKLTNAKNTKNKFKSNNLNLNRIILNLNEAKLQVCSVNNIKFKGEKEKEFNNLQINQALSFSIF